MKVIDNRKRRRKNRTSGKFRRKIRENFTTCFFVLMGTAILGVLISHFFSRDNNKIEKDFYVKNEDVDKNKLHDKDANRVMRLAGEFFEKRIDEISKFSKK